MQTFADKIQPVSLNRLYQQADAQKSNALARKTNEFNLDQAQTGEENKNRLAGMLSESLKTGNRDVSEMAAIDPEFGMKAHQAFSQMDDTRRKRAMEEMNWYGGSVVPAMKKAMQAGANPQELMQSIQAQAGNLGFDTTKMPQDPNVFIQQIEAVYNSRPKETKSSDLVKVSDGKGGAMYVPASEAANQSAYVKPDKPTKESFTWAYDPALKKTVRATDAEIQAKGLTKVPSGMKITQGPNGELTMVSGEMAAQSDDLPMTRATQGAVEKQIVEAYDKLARVDQILSSWKPEFSTLSKQIETAWANLKDRSGVDYLKLSDAEKTDLAAYDNWSATAYSNLNQTLKEMSGAAVNEHEMKRLVKSLPNPAEDGPTRFIQKAQTLRHQITLAIGRLNYFRRKGIPANFEKMSLGQFESVFDQRGEEIMQEITAANPNIQEDDAFKQANATLRAEFGI